MDTWDPVWKAVSPSYVCHILVWNHEDIRQALNEECLSEKNEVTGLVKKLKAILAQHVSIIFKTKAMKHSRVKDKWQ